MKAQKACGTASRTEDKSTNRVGTSVAGGLPWRKKRCQRAKDMAKKSIGPRAADRMIACRERKIVMIEDTSTEAVMKTEGMGMVAAGGQTTAVMGTKTHVIDPGVAVVKSMTTRGATKKDILLTGMPMMTEQGMQISTAVETAANTTDADTDVYCFTSDMKLDSGDFVCYCLRLCHADASVLNSITDLAFL